MKLLLIILFFAPTIFSCAFGLTLGSEDYGRKEQALMAILSAIQTLFVWFLIYKVFM